MTIDVELPPDPDAFAHLVDEMVWCSPDGERLASVLPVDQTHHRGPGEQLLSIYRAPRAPEIHGSGTGPPEFLVFAASCLRHELVTWGQKLGAAANLEAVGTPLSWSRLDDTEWQGRLDHIGAERWLPGLDLSWCAAAPAVLGLWSTWDEWAVVGLTSSYYFGVFWSTTA
ncbi:MAG: hypothetical protein JWM47_2874 [Acidimicrobiales bacterium]|nr:hypothetical protein [Acidimicrobiales bacterium]